MSITPEQIAHVLELDSKKTQPLAFKVVDAKIVCFLIRDLGYNRRIKADEIESLPIAPSRDDVAFIAAAPLMAQIIRHQQEQLRVAREALEIVDRTIQARALILVGSAYHDIIKQALSLIGDKS